MPATALAALLDAVSRDPRRHSLEARARRVDFGQHAVVLGADALQERLVQPPHVLAGEVERVRGRKKGEEIALLRLVIDDLHFALARRTLPITAGELTPHRRVANRDGRRAAEGMGGVHDDVCAHEHHRGVRQLRVRGLGVRAIRVDPSVAHEHVVARNAVVVEAQKAVVVRLVGKLGSDVADSDPRQRHVVALAAQGDNERVRPMVRAIDEQPRKDDGVVRSLAKATRPPLGRRQRRRVEDKLLRAAVVCGRRLNALHVRPVAELRLRVRPDDGIVAGERSPLGNLLVGALAKNGWQEHAVVQPDGKVLVNRPAKRHRFLGGRQFKLARKLDAARGLFERPLVLLGAA
eukprot:Opistho-1_new@103757